MKAKRNISRILGLGSLLALAFGITAPRAHAGPGPQYWTNKPQAKTEQAAQSSLPAAATICTDSKTVAITETKNAWANGRGPLQVTEVGSKRACTSCGSFTVMKPDWHNARGPLHPVTITAQHDCNSACVTPTRD
jgi:hypothetical protein